MHKISRIHPIMEILNSSPQRVSQIMIQLDSRNSKVQEVAVLARTHQISIVFVPKKHLDRFDRHHQGLVAFVARKELSSLEDILVTGDRPFLVLLDGIEDPQNLGAIMRSAEGAGVDGIILPERRVARLTDTVYSVSSGALEYLQVAQVKNLARTMDELRDNGIWLVGAEGGQEKLWYEFDYKEPVALILGSEGKGLHDLIKKKCDEILSVPLLGNITSLNVAAAAAIFMFEVVRQRQQS